MEEVGGVGGAGLAPATAEQREKEGGGFGRESGQDMEKLKRPREKVHIHGVATSRISVCCWPGSFVCSAGGIKVNSVN
jgi:hypothetical protein